MLNALMKLVGISAETAISVMHTMASKSISYQNLLMNIDLRKVNHPEVSKLIVQIRQEVKEGVPHAVQNWEKKNLNHKNENQSKQQTPKPERQHKECNESSKLRDVTSPLGYVSPHYNEINR